MAEKGSDFLIDYRRLNCKLCYHSSQKSEKLLSQRIHEPLWSSIRPCK